MNYLISFLLLSEFIAVFFEEKWIPSKLDFLVSFCIIIFLVLKKRRTLSNKENHKSLFLFGFIFCSFLIRILIIWIFDTFPLTEAEKVVLTLHMPITGFLFPFIKDFLIYVVAVSLALAIFFFVASHRLGINGKWIIAFSICIIVISFTELFVRIPFQTYQKILNEEKQWSLEKSMFFQNHYEPVNLKENYPKDSTRNLILIIMESMENWPVEFIPELYYLAEHNIKFSKNGLISSGEEAVGANNTISATVSKLTGVPLFITPITGDTILPKVQSVYDVMHKDNFYNVFLQGTNSDFANTKKFLLSHGINHLYDSENITLEHAKKIRKRLNHFDVKITDGMLYVIAKNILDTLQKKDHFSLTIATIETHFPYGIYDSNCKEKPESISNQAKLVATLKCASRQVNDFVAWIKTQNFANNTEIIIVGDHLFAGKSFTENRERFWLNIFINSQKKPIFNSDRSFTSIDIAPTILESMGFELSNHKMGFGTSLFSAESTLLEKDRANFYSNINSLKRSEEYNLLMVH